jgi:hypothetical protein
LLLGRDVCARFAPRTAAVRGACLGLGGGCLPSAWALWPLAAWAVTWGALLAGHGDPGSGVRPSIAFERGHGSAPGRGRGVGRFRGRAHPDLGCYVHACRSVRPGQRLCGASDMRVLHVHQACLRRSQRRIRDWEPCLGAPGGAYRLPSGAAWLRRTQTANCLSRSSVPALTGLERFRSGVSAGTSADARVPR